MLPQEGFALPSSPHSGNKTSWDDLFLDFCSYQNEMICPTHILKEQTPRTEGELPISMARQAPYSPVSPVIKQASDYEYSQPDYAYTASNEYRCLSQAERWFFATPKIPSWDYFIDDTSKSSLGTYLPQSPLEEVNLVPPNTGLSVPTGEPEFGLVEIKWPSSRQVFSNELPPAKRTRKNLQFFVTLHLTKHKLLLGVINFSGPEKEYRLPIFTELQSLESMLLSGDYDIIRPVEDHGSVLPLPDTTGKRYVSRLTRFQLANVLGVQNYDISLVKDIEEIIITLCDQLCGLKIGESPWSKVPRNLRKASVAKVHRFAKVFFPSFTMDNVLTIIKRGAYSRTQDFLRRKRRRERKFSVEEKSHLI